LACHQFGSLWFTTFNRSIKMVTLMYIFNLFFLTLKHQITCKMSPFLKARPISGHGSSLSSLGS
jgi:hypothetical protein